MHRDLLLLGIPNYLVRTTHAGHSKLVGVYNAVSSTTLSSPRLIVLALAIFPKREIVGRKTAWKRRSCTTTSEASKARAVPVQLKSEGGPKVLRGSRR